VIDLHAHVLPGIDDGPATTEESVDLARAAAGDGTRTLVATPHLRHDYPNVRVEELADRCAEVRGQLRAEETPIEIVPGGEIDFEWAQNATAEELRLASYGQVGTDVLLETPYAPVTPAFDGALFRLASMGFRVLLAHPERNPTFQQDRGRLEALVRRGALVQLTAGSLLETGRRRPSARLAARLLERGLAHALASDAHTAASWRRPDLSRGVAAADRIAPGIGTWMVTDSAAAILAGEPLPRAPSPRGTRPPLFGRRTPD
jgi:protein-tyrosine phosphatase